MELTHQNLLANVRQCMSVIDLKDSDRFFTCLPLFHGFGLTAGVLLPILRGGFVYLFPSPLMYRQIPKVFYDRDCTVLLATNTFLNSYARFGQAADFAELLCNLWCRKNAGSHARSVGEEIRRFPNGRLRRHGNRAGAQYQQHY